MLRNNQDPNRHNGNRIALGRRGILAGGAAALAGIASRAPAAPVVPQGKLTLAWHTNIAARWLDPQQHDGTASPDNFLMAIHDGLIKNFRHELYDHPALAERFEFAEDAKSATFWLRPGTKFHDGTPVTPADVKWSYEHYRGAWGEVMRERSQGVEVVDDRTVRFHFKAPFLDFPIMLGTSNACGAGWVVPAHYYEKVGQSGFLQKPIGAGPYRLVSQEPGVKLELEAFTDYYRPVHIKQFTMVSVPEAATRVAMLERGEADIAYFIPGELIDRVKNNPKLRLAPVVSGNWWLQFPGFQNPSNPFHDKRVRQAISLAVDRDAINDAECGGMGVVDGNWINDDVEYGLKWPKWPRDLAKAKQLMAEAGVSQRVQRRLGDADAELLFARRAHRVAASGDRHPREAAGDGTRRVPEEDAGRPARVAGRADHLQCHAASAGPGPTGTTRCSSAAASTPRISSASRTSTTSSPSTWHPMTATSANSWRSRSRRRSWRNTTSSRCSAMPSSTRSAPRIAMQKWQDVFPTITTGYAYPWEDIQLSIGRRRRWVSSSFGARCMPLPRCSS